jgi:hypothetical protein
MEIHNTILAREISPTMAPSNRGKKKGKKITSTEKKLTNVAALESKKDQVNSMKTPGGEKKAKRKREKSPSSSSTQKKRKNWRITQFYNTSVLHPSSIAVCVSYKTSCTPFIAQLQQCISTL